MRAVKFGVGQSVARKEDDLLLRGRGRYIADSAPRGALCAVVLRSPHTHARFRIDATGANTVLEVPPYPVPAAGSGLRH